MIERWIAFTLLFPLVIFSAFADDDTQKYQQGNMVNYDYFYADLSSGSFDENIAENSNVTALAIGVSSQYHGDWLLGFDYSARFVHHDNTTDEYYTMQPAVGYRFPILSKFEISPRAKVGFKRLNNVEKDSEIRLLRHDDFIYGFDVKAAYQLSKRLELAAIGELIRSEHFDENIMTLRGDYRISQRFTVGGFYTHRDMVDHTANEGGISLRYYY